MAKRKLRIAWVDATDEHTALHIKFSRALSNLEIDGIRHRLETELMRDEK